MREVHFIGNSEVLQHFSVRQEDAKGSRTELPSDVLVLMNS